MRICDRCGEKAVAKVSVDKDDQHFDLCDACRVELIDFLSHNVNRRSETDGRTSRKRNSTNN